MYSGENLLIKQITLFDSYRWEGNGSRLCVLLMQKGKGCYSAGDVSRKFGAGDVCLFSEKIGGKLSSLDKGGLSAMRFLFYAEQLAPLLVPAELSLLAPVSARLGGFKHFPAASEPARRCQTLLSVHPAKPGIGYRTQLLAIAAAALAHEFEALQPSLAHAADGNGDFANLVNRLSLEDVQKFSVDELATRLGFSRRHLNRLFQEHLGTSVSALKMEIRLLKALFHLQDPSVKVIDVALECGFNHLGLFSQCFKRRFALSPNQWRRRDRLIQGKRTLADLVGDCKLGASGLCLWKNLDLAAKEPKSFPRCPRSPTQNGAACPPFPLQANGRSSRNGRLLP